MMEGGQPKTIYMEKKPRKLIPGVNDLATLSPELIEEWDFDKNKDIQPDQVTGGTSRSAWWKCEKGHSWKAIIANRYRLRRGCPYCANKKVLVGFNDLLSQHPDIAAQWDYERNAGLRPEAIVSGSNIRVWWICEVCGGEWQSSPNNRTRKNAKCPFCTSEMLLPGFNDLATKKPELAKEWNQEKNGKLTPEDVMEYSNKKVWWRCLECGYEWQAKIQNRSIGTGCPSCNSSWKVSDAEKTVFYYIKQCFDDAILSFHPEWMKKEIDIFIPSLNLAVEYDGEHWHKNIIADCDKTVTLKKHGIDLVRFREENAPAINDGSYQIIVSSNYQDQRRLNEPIQKLIAYINERYELGLNCILDTVKDREEINEFISRQKRARSLASMKPDFISEWNYERNLGLFPENIAAYSNKVVWWRCKEGHEWKSSVSNRYQRGCPYCANKKILPGYNDLATREPEVAKEWDYTANDPLLPSDVSAGSSKRVSWICSKCGCHWKTSIANRSYGYGCPKCGRIKAGISHSITNQKKREANDNTGNCI